MRGALFLADHSLLNTRRVPSLSAAVLCLFVFAGMIVTGRQASTGISDSLDGAVSYIAFRRDQQQGIVLRCFLTATFALHLKHSNLFTVHPPTCRVTNINVKRSAFKGLKWQTSQFPQDQHVYAVKWALEVKVQKQAGLCVRRLLQHECK